LLEVVHLVDAGEGVHFGDLVATVCPDPDTAARALADLLVTAADLPDQPPEATVERLLTDWDPIITSVATAAATDHTPTELTDALDHHGATTDWATLVAALRRVLAGERDRERLLVGLDDVDAAIVTATLDRLPTDPRQELMTSAATLDALTDHQAVRVLAVVVDHHAPCRTPPGSGNSTLPWPTPSTTPTCSPTTGPARHHPVTVISSGPPSPTSPPPAPTSPR